LVTGCSSGIGRAAAEMLRDRGWRVVPSARKDEDMDALRCAGFEPVHIELTDADSVATGFEKAQAVCGGDLGAVVNNAGYGQPGALEDIPRTTLAWQFEVNVIGMQHLTNLCIPVFRAQGYGRIVNVSSVLGRITMPFMGAYCASKYAMEALSDALRVELHGSGIAVSIIEPGPINTDFGKNSSEKLRALDEVASIFGNHYETQARCLDDRKGRKDPYMRPPSAAAAKIVKALESRRPASRYKVTLPAYAGAFIRRFAPDSFLDMMFVQLWKKRAGE